LSENNQKAMKWLSLAFIGYNVVWGFGNVVNNFATQGIKAIFSWIVILALYFLPYTLIVGKLGATFKDGKGGVSSWIKATSTKTLAYFAAWTYWVVHIPYLAQKPSAIIVALSWLIKGDKSLTTEGFLASNPVILPLIYAAVFLIFVFLVSRGIKTIQVLGGAAGMAMFIMGMLFIVLAVAGPAAVGMKAATPDLGSVSTYIPKFDFKYFTTLSMLVFAVGGAEKISPYVTSLAKPGKEFPKAMIGLTVLVGVSAFLGTIGMAVVFDGTDLTNKADMMTNGAYFAFDELGNHYHVGGFLMRLYALANAVGQMAALAISIDAPLRILLSDSDKEYIPESLRYTNDKGMLTNGYKLTSVLVLILIMIPALGLKGATDFFATMTQLNSIVMPMRYLWVFAAFMFLMWGKKHFDSEYKLFKNKKLSGFLGLWCFVFTAFVCIMGVFPDAGEANYTFKLILNIVTPIVLILLGLIMPILARRHLAKNEA
jgi:amino acid transporter